MVLLGGSAQMVEDHSGQHPRQAACRVDVEDLRHVLGEIQDDRNIAALSSQGCPTASAEERRAKFPAQSNRGNYVIYVMREYDSDRYLAIVGTVGGVEGAAAIIKADLATDVLTQCNGQIFGIDSDRFGGSSELCEAVLHGEPAAITGFRQVVYR